MNEITSHAHDDTKYFMYVNTALLDNKVIETVIDCLAGIYSDKLNIDLSVWDIERIRSRKPLFGFVFNNTEFKIGSLFSWDELAAYGKEGVKIHQVDDFRQFFCELKNTYRYFRFVNNPSD